MVAVETYSEEQIADGLSETARSVNRLMLTLLALGLFSLLAVGQPDAFLLTPAATISVPSIGAASAKALLIVGPLLLIGVRIYLQIYVEHWRTLDAAAKAGKITRALVISPLRHGLLRFLAGAVLYLLVPVALAVFTWKAMAIPKWWGYSLFIVTVFVSAVHLIQDWRREWTIRLYFCANTAAAIGVVGGAVFIEDMRRIFDLRAADLKLTDLSGYDLRGANLRQADLTGANLDRTKFQNARLWSATLTSAILTNANLTGADLRSAILQDAILFEATLTNADLRLANLTNADLRLANLTNAKLRLATLTKANLSEATLTNADLRSATLKNADLSGATLTKANLVDTKLKNADLTWATLTEAKLNGATLTNAELHAANFQGANLSNANFWGAKGLMPKSFENACYESKAMQPLSFKSLKFVGPPRNLPDGIIVPLCKTEP